MALNFPTDPEGEVFNGFIYKNGVWLRGRRKTALPKNYIINPSFQISQQNGDFAGSTNGYYPADQWVLSTTMTGYNMTASRVAVGLSPSGSPNTLYFNVDAGP